MGMILSIPEALGSCGGKERKRCLHPSGHWGFESADLQMSLEREVGLGMGWKCAGRDGESQAAASGGGGGVGKIGGMIWARKVEWGR